MAAGRLFLVPCLLSDGASLHESIPPAVLERVRGLDAFVAENAKSARAFLAACGHPRPLRDIAMWELNEHTSPQSVPALLQPLREGRDLGLLSEAGAPAVADPGALLVAAAHGEGIRVVPLVGPSSILLALMASGLEGQRFRFHGYLPVEAAARCAKLLEIERQSSLGDETQVFIETPYRNDALLADVLRTCDETTRLAVATELTGPGESIRMDSIAGWRAKAQALGKRPAVFLLLGAARRAR
jgi:16S rRNA (cytidine1402-2'-O)-methyltransferase